LSIEKIACGKIIFTQAGHGTKREQKFRRPQGILTGKIPPVNPKNEFYPQKIRPVLLGADLVLLGE
jgi:hypothetical protein